MAKKHTTFFSCFLLPMLFLSTGSLRAGETDSIFQQQPAVFTSQASLSISNVDVFIAKNTDIALSGDLALNNAAVTGQGSLILKSSQDQTIRSKNSTVSHLEIRNPKTVALIGDLAITQSLVIDTGIFDVSKGNLQIDPSHIFLLHKGSLFTGHEAQFKSASETSLMAETISLTGSYNGGNAVLQPQATAGYPKKAKLFFKEPLYSNIVQNLPLQPPRLS